MSEKKKQQRRVSFNVFLDTKTTLGCTDNELTEALGYNKTTWHGWLHEGEMPYVAGVACEALVRRKGLDPDKQGPQYLVLKLEDGLVKSFTRVTVKEIQMDGKEYWMVPIPKGERKDG